MPKQRDIIEHIRQFAADPIRHRPGVTSTLTIGPEECDQILAAIAPADSPTYGELAAAVREMAATRYVVAEMTQGVDACRFCEGEVKGHYRLDPPAVIQHDDDCLYVRCCQLAARLPPA